MKKSSEYYIVEKDILPEVFEKVMEVKRFLMTNDNATVHDAVKEVGISRSAFYKYKESIFPFYENTMGKTLTIAVSLEDRAGLLSALINIFANNSANILTINQAIPQNKMANVTMTIETGKMEIDIGTLLETVRSLKGCHTLTILSRE